jgi:hypothetical protein
MLRYVYTFQLVNPSTITQATAQKSLVNTSNNFDSRLRFATSTLFNSSIRQLLLRLPH